MVDEKRDPKKNVIGVAWYRRDQWPRLLEISTDRSELEDSYDNWLVHVREAFQRMSNEGIDPVKVDIDTEELLDWCRSRNLAVSARARAQYVTEKVQKSQQSPPH